MKAVFITLGLLFAFLQAGSSESEPTDVSHQIDTALEDCSAKLNFEKDFVIEKMKQNVVPEDNQNAINFFDCFTKALEIQNEVGDPDFEKLLPVVKEMLKRRLTNLDDAAAERIASAAIEHCKDTPKADQAGLSAIKMRNCVRAQAQKTQTL